MGYPREMFDDEIDDELVCPVCWDVLENVICLPCGHAFCLDCIPDMEGGREQVKCPLCRLICLRGVDFTPVRPLQSMVRKQRVRCCAPENATTKMTATASSRMKFNDEKVDAAEEHCEWRGTIDEWETHSNKDCLFADVSCAIQGCTWVGKRKDVHKHNREAYMIHLLLHQKGKSNGEDSLQKYSPRLLNRKHSRDQDLCLVDSMHRRRRPRAPF